jgi:predicted nuclease of predicted toxin-antitoxin system
MRLLVDECCDLRLVTALREDGHDAVWSRDLDPGASDAAVMAMARASGRIVVTHDVGFGERAMRGRAALPGLVLIRIRPRDRDTVAARQLALIAARGDDLRGAIAVPDDRGERVRHLGK